MAKKTPLIKWAFVLLVIIAILLVLSLTSATKSQSKVDYIAEYDRINKPDDFDPNDNAAPYFDKAFAIMAEMSDDIKNLQKLWPADMNEDQLKTTKQWVESNRQTLSYLKQATSKKYYWKPLQVDINEFLMTRDTNEIAQFRKAVYLLCIDAKLKANDGQIRPALQQLADAYKMGTFLAGPKFVIDQLVGMGISAVAVRSAFQIVDHTNPPPALLEGFQQQIASLSSKQPFLINFFSEKLACYDVFDGLLAGRDQPELSKRPELLFSRKFFTNIFRWPWLTMEKYQARKMFDYLDAARLKTPWQLHNERIDVNDVAARMVKLTLLSRILAPSLSRALLISYRVQTYTDGLITTIAVLRYKADKGRYPQDIQELVTAGYLAKLPIDAFSGNSLVYKLSGDNFILYSFAKDFDDDSGRHDPEWADKGDGDFVFWPVQYTEHID